MDLSKEIRQIEISEEEFVVCCRSDHPLKGTEPSIEQVTALIKQLNTTSGC